MDTLTKEDAFQSVLLRCPPLETITRDRIFPDNNDQLFIVPLREFKYQTISVSEQEYEALNTCESYEVGAIKCFVVSKSNMTRMPGIKGADYKEFQITLGFLMEFSC